MNGWVALEPNPLADALASTIAGRRSHAWLLLGPAGVGKSTLASAISRRLSDVGIEVFTVVGDAGIATVPLGAFLPALAASAADGASPEEQLGRLLARLSRASANAAIVVDNAALLDERSAATVLQLVKVYGVRCVFTARPSQRLGEAFHRLDDEGFVETIEVQALDANQAASVIEHALGAPVSPESMLQLITRTGGNPLWLRMLLAAAEREGLIAPGPQGLVVGAPMLPKRIASLLAEPLADLAETEAATLELVCVAARLPGRGIDPGALQSLTALGLVTRTELGDVTPASQLLAETVIATLDADALDRRRIDAASIMRDAADAADAGGLALESADAYRLAAIVLLAASSAPPDVAELAWAARAATQRDAYSLAISLAEQADAVAVAHGTPRPVDALTLRGEALSLLGRLDDADDAFAIALQIDADDAVIALAAARASAHWAIRRHDPARAAALGLEALARLTDPDARAFVASNVSKWRIMMGAAPEEPMDAAPPGGSEAAIAAAALDANLARVIGAMFGGDLDGAKTAIAAGRPYSAAAQPIVRHGAELFDFADALVIALDARIDDALQQVEPYLAHRFAEGAGMWSYGAALLQRQAGLIEESAQSAAAAVDQLAWRDFVGARGSAIGLRATAAVLLGDLAAADTFIAELTPALRTVVPANLQAAEAITLRRHAAGDPNAVDDIADAIASAIESGYSGWAAFSAATAMRIGRADAVIDSLRIASERSAAPLLRMVVEQAEAQVAADAERILVSAAALERAGMIAAAHDAASSCLALARTADNSSLVRRAAVVLGRTAARLTPARRRSEAASILTRREWDVAVAAAARERNREIADRLGLSLRTVENHLANAYRKLGVSGRDELRDQLG